MTDHGRAWLTTHGGPPCEADAARLLNRMDAALTSVTGIRKPLALKAEAESPRKAAGRHQQPGHRSEPMKRHTELTSRLLEQIDRSALSDRQVSLRATGKPDTVRNIRRGANPRSDTANAICEALRLEMRIERVDDPIDNAPRPETRFDESNQLPVRTWEDPGEKPAAEGPQKNRTAPAPENWADPHAFYAVMRGRGLEPARVENGEVCLVSPAAALPVDTLAWLSRTDGTETAGWLADTTPDAFGVVRWTGAGEREPATPVLERVGRDQTRERGAISAVYTTLPTACAAMRPKPAWTPGPAATLWRTATIDGNETLGKLLEAVNQAAAQVDEMFDRVRRYRREGAISHADARLFARAATLRLKQFRDSLRERLEETDAARRTKGPQQA